MKIIKISLAILFSLLVLYVGAWFTMAHYMDKAIMQFYIGDGPAHGFVFYDGMPETQGFPFKPYIVYRYGFNTDEYNVSFEDAKISGFPIPGLPINIDINGELVVFKNGVDIDVVLDRALLTFIAPKYFPQTTFFAHIDKWQEEIGQIEIIDAEIARKDFLMSGRGSIGLDDNLQYAIDIQTKTYQFETLVEFFVSNGSIDPFIGILALSGLNSMAKTDSESNKKYLEADLKIKDRQFSIGPIKPSGKFNKVEWR